MDDLGDDDLRWADSGNGAPRFRGTGAQEVYSLVLKWRTANSFRKELEAELH